ncbi:hypothetical protein BOX15_Mlig000516g2, partial [Macrostomum lignano]
LLQMGNSQSSIAPNLQHAQATGVLQLSGKKLEEWPAAIHRLNNNLRTLDLSNNRLTSVSTSIDGMVQLKQLTLSSNRLTGLPDQVCSLSRLTILSLERNFLQSLPVGFSQLKSLKTLQLSGNKFKDFPASVLDLPALELLDLSTNSITQLPGNMSNLKAVELNLNQNQLKLLSDSLADCPRLRILRLQENCLPIDQFTPKLLRDSQISLLAVEGNLFLMKQFDQLEGSQAYQERVTAVRRKAEH